MWEHAWDRCGWRLNLYFSRVVIKIFHYYSNVLGKSVIQGLPKPRRRSPEPAIQRINFLFIIHWIGSNSVIIYLSNHYPWNLVSLWHSPIHYSPIACIQCPSILSSEKLLFPINLLFIKRNLFSGRPIQFF